MAGVMKSFKLLLGLLLLLACREEGPPFRETPLEPLGGEAQANGSLRIPLRSQPVADLSIQLEGLEPGASYVLCLNTVDAGTDTSAALGNLGLPGWPLGAFAIDDRGREHGYWDFEKFRADEGGRYAENVQLPLPPMEYRLRLLVKRSPADGSRSILQSETLLLSVDPLLEVRRWASGAGLALAFAGLGLVMRSQRRTREQRAAPSSETLPGPAAASEPAGFDAGIELDELVASEVHPIGEPLAQVPAQPPRTLIERARAEGVFLHHKNYAWVEIHGRRKSFRPRQALVFHILCEQDPNCDGLPQEQIVKEWEHAYKAKRANPVRVLDIFRSHPDEPGDFIERVPGSASVYRLRLEPRAAEEESDSLPGEFEDRYDDADLRVGSP
jgi:hypothetical protein